MQRRRIERRIRATVHRAEAREEVSSESRNIAATFAQRRNWNRKHVQAEKKIFAEATRCNGFRKIGIRERHQARVHAQRIRAAQPLEGALFDHAQQLGLHTGRQRGDFVENDRAALRHFEAALLACDSTSKCAALVAKKFGFDKLSRKAGAINFQKGRVATRPVLMNPARELIFSRAALAGDQQRGGRLGELGGKLKNTKRGGISSDPFKAQREPVSRRAVLVSRVAASYAVIGASGIALMRCAGLRLAGRFGGRVGAGKSMRSAVRQSRSRS